MMEPKYKSLSVRLIVHVPAGRLPKGAARLALSPQLELSEALCNPIHIDYLPTTVLLANTIRKSAHSYADSGTDPRFAQ